MLARALSAVRCAVSTSTKAVSCSIRCSCDGVIVETEELHRKAYNAAFAAFECTIDGKPLVWSVEYYVS